MLKQHFPNNLANLLDRMELPLFVDQFIFMSSSFGLSNWGVRGCVFQCGILKALLNIFLTLFCRYTKYLYPLECSKKNLSNPNELQAAIEGNKREGRRTSYGTYPSELLPPHHPHAGHPHLPPPSPPWPPPCTTAPCPWAGHPCWMAATDPRICLPVSVKDREIWTHTSYRYPPMATMNLQLSEKYYFFHFLPGSLRKFTATRYGSHFGIEIKFKCWTSFFSCSRNDDKTRYFNEVLVEETLFFQRPNFTRYQSTKAGACT